MFAKVSARYKKYAQQQAATLKLVKPSTQIERVTPDRSILETLFFRKEIIQRFYRDF